MKVIVVPPLRLDEENGARTRTLEIYSRLSNQFELTFAVDRTEEGRAEKHYLELLKGLKTVYAYTGRNPIKVLISFIRLVSRARRMDAVLCYANYQPSIVYSYLIARVSRKPLIITIHIIEDSARNRSYLMNKAFDYCSGLLALDNGKIVRELEAMFPGKLVAPIKNGVDYDSYSSGAYSDDKLADCLFVGVLTERKGFNELIGIWKRVQDVLPTARLLILAGVTPKQRIDAFKNSATEHGIKDGLTVLSYISEEAKIGMYRRSSVFILPSKDEGMALVIPEALAAGLPVVLWDIQQFGLIEKGVLKVPYGDLDRFAQSIIHLLSDDEFRNSTIADGKEFAKSSLSWNGAAILEARSIRALNLPGDEQMQPEDDR